MNRNRFRILHLAPVGAGVGLLALVLWLRFLPAPASIGLPGHDSTLGTPVTAGPDGPIDRVRWEGIVLEQPEDAEASSGTPAVSSRIVVPDAEIQVDYEGADKPVRTFSDKDGRFKIDLAPSPSRYLISVLATQYEEEDFELTVRDLRGTVYLRRNAVREGSVIAGIVRDAVTGDALGGAEAHVLDRPKRSAISASDGSFKILISGEAPSEQGWNLVVGLGGYAPARLSGAFPGYPYDVALFRQVQIQGHVFSESGVALSGASVKLDRCPHPARHQTGTVRKALAAEIQENPCGQTGSRGDGYYSVSGPLSASACFVSVRVPGFVPSASPCFTQVPPAGAEGAIITYDFKLQKALRLRGKVQTPDGKGVPKAHVWLSPPPAEASWYLESPVGATDANGDFEIGSLGAVTYTGTAEAPNGTVRYKECKFEANPSEDRFVTLILEVERSDNLKIKLSGASVSSGPVHVLTVPLELPPIKLQHKGLLLRPGAQEGVATLPIGRYLLLAYTADGSFGESMPFLVTESGTATVEIALSAGGVVNVALVSEQGRFSKRSSNIVVEAWNSTVNAWVALPLSTTEGDLKSPASVSKGSLKVSVPATRSRLRVGTKVLAEVVLPPGGTKELGEIVLDE